MLESSDCAERHLGSDAIASCHERPSDQHRSGASIAATSAHQLPFFDPASSLLLCFGTGVGGTRRGDGGGDTVITTEGAVAARGRMPFARMPCGDVPFGCPVPNTGSSALLCNDG